MNLEFTSKQQESEALSNASDSQLDLVKQQTAKRDGTLLGNGVLQFSYKKTTEGKYIAHGEYCGNAITLTAWSTKGLKMLVVKFLKTAYKEIRKADSEKVKAQTETTHNIKLDTTLYLTDIVKMVYSDNDSKVLEYSVLIRGVELSTKIHYSIKDGTFKEAYGTKAQDKQKLLHIFDYVPKNIFTRLELERGKNTIGLTATIRLTDTATIVYDEHDDKAIKYSVIVDGVQLNTKLHYKRKRGTFIEAYGGDKQKLVDIYEHIPQNIYYHSSTYYNDNEMEAQTNLSWLVDDIKCEMRYIQRLSEYVLDIYAGISEDCNRKCRVFRVSSMKDEHSTFLVNSRQFILIANYLSGHCKVPYMEILKVIQHSVNHMLEATSYNWALVDGNSQTIPLSQLNLIDTLFVNYFTEDSNEVEPHALFTSEVDNTGLVRAYSFTDGHKLLHPNILHVPQLEYSEYSLLLDALIEFGYNVNILNAR